MSISNSGQMLSQRVVSATHHALACPDIILEIIEQVPSPSDGPSKARHDNRRMLAALARSCRAFNGPATKVLWSQLDTFFPLLNIFSAFHGHQTVPDTSPPCMISGNILPQEFARFRELGGFLQAVAPSDCICEFDTPNSDVWYYLSRISGGKPLFPSLRELHWAIRQPSSAGILFLLTSSLRRLTICYSDDNQDSDEWQLGQGMLFRTIFDVAPLLTHLTFADINHMLLSACLSNVNNLQGLRVLSLCQNVSVDLDILRSLSSIGSLEELSFAVDIDWLDEPSFSGFSTLKKLEMITMSGSVESARSYLTSFSSPGLRQLTFRIQTELLNVDEIYATCTLFAHRFPSLEDLTWTFLIRPGVPLELALAPLFPLRMTKLSLELIATPTTPPLLTDDLFATLARAWPRLTVLSVVVPDERADALRVATGHITAHTLLALAHAGPVAGGRAQAPDHPARAAHARRGPPGSRAGWGVRGVCADVG
ncbi:hypothetical protein V8D89_008467 [Ganoderma adspersum]